MCQMLLPTFLCTDWMLMITLWERYYPRFTNKEMEAGRDELGAMVHQDFLKEAHPDSEMIRTEV